MKNIMQMFSLKGACSLVTGGAGALGSRMCEGLAQAGSDVVILDLAIEKAEALAKSLQRYGVRVRAYALDTTDEEQAERVCEKIVEEFGRIDVLVNAAGIPNKGTLVEDNNFEEFTRVLDVNIGGTFIATKVFGRQMRKQKKGSIINIASGAGTHVNKPIIQPSYNSSKAGLLMMTQCIAVEWAKEGVRVNSVSPGFMTHEMAGGMFPSSGPKHDTVMEALPIGRIAEPEELVGAILYLASDASSFTTGIDILVDGARHCW